MQQVSQRLYSLDALRGFDMFWIMGADAVLLRLARVSDNPFWKEMAVQMDHPAWNGFHFYDLIFPLFLFLAGVATPFSIGRKLKNGEPKGVLVRTVIKRGLILVLLGIVVNNGLEIREFADIRFASVLGRIGLAYMFANLIYLYSNQLGIRLWFAGILIGYWLILKFTSAPGFPVGDLSMEGNFASYVDRLILPGKLYLKIHDPEGLFSTIPAIATGLLGVFAGNLLKNSTKLPQSKALHLGIAGLISIVISLIWNLDFPINKNLWSSSFVLLTGGISLVLLSLFYYVIDVLGHKKWAFFFKVIGMNSILIYMVGGFIDFDYTTDAFFHWLGQLVGDPYQMVVMSILLIAVKWVFLYFLYKKKVFLKV